MAGGDTKERQSGQHYDDDPNPARTYRSQQEHEAAQNDAELTPAERRAFDDIAAKEEQQELRAEAESAGAYTPQNNPYDDTGMYHDRSGYTRRDASQHAGFTRRIGDDGRHADDNSGYTRRDLRNAEENGGLAGAMGGGKSGSGVIPNLADKENTPFSYSNTGPKWAKARSFVQKHKKKIIAGGLAGVGVFPLLALLLFILGALKIPHFVENVAAWRLATVSRAYRNSMTNVIGEKNAFDALNDQDKEKARAKYGKYQAFDKVNRLRPNRVLQSLQAEDRIQYNYKKTVLGRDKLTSITIAPGDDLKQRVTVDVPTGRFDRIIHPIRTIDRYKAISDSLNSAMRAHDPKISVVTRSLVTKQVLQKAGASLKGMAAQKYLGKSDREAKITIQQETYEKAHRNGGIATISDERLRQVAEDTDKAQTDAMSDREQVGQMVDKGQDIPDAASTALERGLNGQKALDVIEQVVKVTNPAYDIVAVTCMAYDGSKIKAGSIDATHDAKVSEAAFVFSTNDQIKDGTTMNTAAANAMNWKLGNIRESNAIRRQEGRPVNTLDTVGSQRSTMGGYSVGTTIFDIMGIGFLNDSADEWCPKLTNLWVGLGIGLGLTAATIVTSIFSGGGTAAVSATARAGAEQAVKKTVSKVMANALKKGIKNFSKAGRFGKEAVKGTAKFAALAASATFLAKWIVMSKTGGLNSGAEKDVSFDDNVDEGAFLMAGDMNRANFYARPLNNVETVQSHKLDRAEQAYFNAQRSPFERYLALENPNSMAARMATTVGTLANKSIFASMLNSMANLFNPIGLSSKLFANANGSSALAATNINDEDYGDVYWDMSYEETQLMKQPSYASPSENEYQLDQSGKESEIEGKYSKCYTESIGKLLEDQDIVRDEEGNVTDDGDCSPEALGPDNPTYGDLVFRWRLKHNYENTSDNLLGIQDPSEQEQVQESANLGNIPSGTAQELAKKILNNKNISFQTPAGRDAMEYIASTGHARTCGNKSISPLILGILLSAASNYKLVVGVLTDGHGCNSDPYTKAHSKGLAVDVNGVNPINGGGGGTGNFITAADYKSNKLLRDLYEDLGDIVAQAGGGELGQIQCFSSPPKKNAKVHYFNDACNHLHIDVFKS